MWTSLAMRFGGEDIHKCMREPRTHIHGRARAPPGQVILLTDGNPNDLMQTEFVPEQLRAR